MECSKAILVLHEYTVIMLLSLTFLSCLTGLQLHRASALPAESSQHEVKIPIGPLRARQVDTNTADYYLGYRTASDFDTPWAKYYNDTPPGESPQFQEALAVRAECLHGFWSTNLTSIDIAAP